MNVAFDNPINVNNMGFFSAFRASIASGLLSTTGGFTSRYIVSSDGDLNLFVNGLTPNYDALQLGGQSSTDVYLASSKNHIGVNSKTDGVKLYSNYKTKDLSALGSSTISSIKIGNKNITEDCPFVGDIYSFVVFNIGKTDADFETIISRSETTFDLINPADCAANLVFDGDSITYGSAATLNRGWVNQLKSIKRQSFYNLGISNNTYDFTSVKGASRTDRLINPDKINILVVFLGTNDVFNFSQTGAATYADAVSYAQARKTAGYDHVVMLTCLPRSNGNAERDTFNTLLKANTTDFDAVVDVATDPCFQYRQLEYQSGVFAYNNLYSFDGTHPTTEGMRVISGYVDPILERYINSNASSLDLGKRIVNLENQIKALSEMVILNRKGKQKADLGITGDLYTSGVYGGETGEDTVKIGGNKNQGGYAKGLVQINPMKDGYGNGFISFNGNEDVFPKNMFLFKKNGYNREIGGFAFIGPTGQQNIIKIGTQDTAGVFGGGTSICIIGQDDDGTIYVPNGNFKIMTPNGAINFFDKLILPYGGGVKVNTGVEFQLSNAQTVSDAPATDSTKKIRIKVGDTYYHLLAIEA